MREIGAIRLENVLCFFPCVFRACTCPGFSDLDSSLAFSSSPPFFYAVALRCFVKIQGGGDDRGREKMKVGTPPPLGVTTKACTGQKPRTRLLLFLLLLLRRGKGRGEGERDCPIVIKVSRPERERGEEKLLFPPFSTAGTFFYRFAAYSGSRRRRRG